MVRAARISRFRIWVGVNSRSTITSRLSQFRWRRPVAPTAAAGMVPPVGTAHTGRSRTRCCPDRAEPRPVRPPTPRTRYSRARPCRRAPSRSPTVGTSCDGPGRRVSERHHDGRALPVASRTRTVTGKHPRRPRDVRQIWRTGQRSPPAGVGRFASYSSRKLATITGPGAFHRGHNLARPPPVRRHHPARPDRRGRRGARLIRVLFAAIRARLRSEPSGTRFAAVGRHRQPPSSSTTPRAYSSLRGRPTHARGRRRVGVRLGRSYR